MLGDAHDLASVIQWARKHFWVENLDPEDGLQHEWPYPEEVRLDVNESLVDLCRSFDNSEQAHRKQFHLTGAKKEIQVG